MKNKVSVFWFRRDLRLEDNVGLYQALASELPVLPVFIFDETILTQLEDKKDRRVDYIHQVLSAINSGLKTFNARLNTFYGNPLDVFKMLSEKYAVQGVFCNRDYEPQAIKRDMEIYQFFNEQNISFKAFKDQVIFDKNDVLKNDGTPYTVYTPYSKKWKELLTEKDYKSYNPDCTNFFRQRFAEIHSLNEFGFEKTDITFDPPKLDAKIIDEYEKFRDYPAMQRTTELSIALRFGTINIRKCVAFALNHNQTWLNELIWREFFMQILYHFPKVVNQSFKSKYDNIKWRNNEREFEKWCEGKTGYPIVDAGMRQLNQTGFMHNRVRMITASFLCKHLLIDWRWGEAYFAQKLNDYDLSANNGNWQWASGSGCDAAPYFRVFNPTVQTEKFDKNLEYIKKWVPEFGTDAYPQQIVEHSFARDRALKVYGEAVRENNQ
ncbi:deoxyribodipyrimidine photo-lyase [Paenimyroides aquimaris]|uniref:Deoxyribodipyrimidine photo-lyase n=1 Tax=Paenimyroides marinum TaxID=1159016 RepID=A0A1H6LE02_9FLAO|nr:deoxyribodipyrimidine photo-lyase [Paenimyroides aquimaris]SEH84290.1 deoxyribodipyrimidine photo-lyase [Paenimyroides aquimaris]